MDIAISIIRDLCFIVGGFFVITGCVGINRLPDFFTRAHATGITDTAGSGLILVGLMLESGLSLDAMKILLILTFLLITSPTSSHVLAKAALHGGMKPLIIQRGAEKSN